MMTRTLSLAASLAALLCVPVSAFAQDGATVMVGGEPSMDACSMYGAVSGLDPQGDNYLSVRLGPGTQHQRIDRLGPDQKLWICDQKGNWLGVVYTKDDTLDCGVSSPQAARAPYSGPCKAGWVYKKYVTLLAG